jgi:acetyltransferase-like isoleucine patch superfamily enzyme
VTTDELTRLLVDLRRESEDQLRERWSRSLGFADALFDRWERARRLGFGDGASIYDSAMVYGTVHVGDRTWIGPFVILDGSGGGLRIGDYCSISAGVQIYTHDTVHWALSGGRVEPRQSPVRIGSRCYVGSTSVIASGVDLGDECVVAAGSFVNDDFPERSHTEER